MKKFVDGTPLFSIIKYGWLNGFHPSTSVLESLEMGFLIDQASVIEIWKLMDFNMDFDENGNGI